jgi:hypothetical protein
MKYNRDEINEKVMKMKNTIEAFKISTEHITDYYEAKIIKLKVEKHYDGIRLRFIFKNVTHEDEWDIMKTFYGIRKSEYKTLYMSFLIKKLNSYFEERNKLITCINQVRLQYKGLELDYYGYYNDHYEPQEYDDEPDINFIDERNYNMLENTLCNKLNTDIYGVIGDFLEI